MFLSTRIVCAIAQWSTWIVANVVEWNLKKDPEKSERIFEDIFRTIPQADYDAWARHSEYRRGLVSGLVSALRRGGKKVRCVVFMFSLSLLT
jgi:hypothetical protein